MVFNPREKCVSYLTAYWHVSVTDVTGTSGVCDSSARIAELSEAGNCSWQQRRWRAPLFPRLWSAGRGPIHSHGRCIVLAETHTVRQPPHRRISRYIPFFYTSLKMPPRLGNIFVQSNIFLNKIVNRSYKPCNFVLLFSSIWMRRW